MLLMELIYGYIFADKTRRGDETSGLIGEDNWSGAARVGSGCNILLYSDTSVVSFIWEERI